ncbi:cupin domain-containing protein [Sphingomonas echinoides]|uniref:cupin domain-containing protein n=1 Tax=Sphingomonas echinoides TaxID=59803 RepID=UPI002413689F|nr:cupin domain-containing protein [Sphingomonas echinoides]
MALTRHDGGRGVILAAFALCSMANAAPADPTGFASPADVASQVAAMDRDMKPGQGFAWKPLLKDGDTIAALEIWKKPGRPAVHPDQAEYATVIAGNGTLISGGTLEQPSATKPDLTEGSRIVGGTTRALKTGDVVLIPAGVPHWFGITGERLVLLGTKISVKR